MRKKDHKGYSQKGKGGADTASNPIAAEEMEKAIHPTNRQNSKQ